ncbi:MAG: phosphoribosyltransferase [Candidatus Doudnabacteria bacterium CG10_big_fil_rev_8_21_14_0_10_42_18]|uniref:Orotate phosphoribosyltransferase n=1 Tax=Candidatus Doudnabacteria bacterium CG10_big_fil_rev_8_21_14_0_10_42_18 TaxID=1974552 RepID=A0A2H0VAS7_9BACT|nr:MAG: phosphoribosyltransferase [Candidatus Doudnabacteria bacterium CG10_big_fil_rev_8_21_14_0_10_42_18]
MKDIFEILESVGGYIKNSHIVGTSGKHLSEYLNKDALYPHTGMSSEVGKMIAGVVRDLEIDVVASPALGGIVLSQWTANHLSKMKGREVFGVYTEKNAEGDQELKRGYNKLIKGKKVLVVEDIINTGGSCKKAVESVRKEGAEVVGVAVMVNRNPDVVNEAYFGAPFFALASRKFPAYEEEDCPMCKAGVPINITVGHGKKYLAGKK